MSSVATGGGAGNGRKRQNPKPETASKPREFNPRWRGYVFIMLASLVSFSSVSNVRRRIRQGELAYAIAVGAFTFGASLMILALDRFHWWEGSFNYTKTWNGALEGYTLLFFLLWWTVGLSVMTRAGGLAYHATNIYFSSWASWGFCLYTLDQWGQAKDILFIRELTALSATLKSWYLLCLSSIIVFASAADIYPRLVTVEHTSEASFAIALGAFSMLVSIFFILVHYKFFPGLRKGGWLELSASFLLILFWIIGVGLLTSDNGIGGSINGQCAVDSGTITDNFGERALQVIEETSSSPSSGPSLMPSVTQSSSSMPSSLPSVVPSFMPSLSSLGPSSSAMPSSASSGAPSSPPSVASSVPSVAPSRWNSTDMGGIAVDKLLEPIPGSNLYFASWASLFSSLMITLRWKAAQALQFAHNPRRGRHQEEEEEMSDDDDDDDGGDDDI